MRFMLDHEARAVIFRSQHEHAEAGHDEDRADPQAFHVGVTVITDIS
jgi:hypothetical protein